MKISQSTELMKNQKYAQALKPDTVFKALQTQEGSSLFFSIGPDGAFYLSRERQADQLGWARVNLSQQFTAIYNTPVTVRTFDVAQDLNAGTIDLVIVVTAGGKDYLYVSLNNANSDADWETANPSWTNLPFDDKSSMNFTGLPLPDVYLAQTGSTEFIIADVLTDTTTNFVTRYYVDPTKSKIGSGQAWNLHASGNLEAGSITSVMGRKGGESFDGIYTLGAIGYEEEIIYTPMYNKHVQGRTPSPIRIALPDGGNRNNTAMAVAATSAPYTDLFVVTNGSLYYLGYSDQVDLAVPAKVYTHALLNGVTTLHVNQWNGQLVLWGLCKDPADGVQKVFIMECQAGSETVDSTYDPTGTGWKCPIPILFNVMNVTTFINNQLSGSVIFAHLADNEGTLIQLSEDPATSAWHQRSILIPEVAINKAYDVNTYTTHLEFTDEVLAPQGDVPVLIRATHAVSVYINDNYYTLSTDTDLTINTDPTGIITIVQEVDSIGAAGYFLTVDDLQAVSVNPLADILTKLNGFNTDADPDPTKLNVTVTDEYGQQSQLVGSGVSDDQKTAAVAGITSFVTSNSSVDATGKASADDPADPTPPAATVAATSLSASQPQISGVSFVKGKEGFYKGAEGVAKMGVVLNADGSLSIQSASLGSIFKAIEAKAGHFLKWLKQEAHKAENIVKHVVGDVVHFYVTLAGEVYHFAVKCLRDIADGIHAMLKAVETAFEDMVKWLGMIFNFQDIKTTHRVMHRIMSLYLKNIVGEVDSMQTQCSDFFNNVLNQITSITGLPPMTDTYSGTATQAPATPGSKSASANWGGHQMKSNAEQTNANTAPSTTSDPTNGLLSQLIADLEAAGDKFEGIKDQVNQLASNVHTMTPVDIIKAIIGIILEVLVEGTEALVSLAITVFQNVIEGVEDALDAPLDIPVISYLYEKAVGDQLTPLGLATFIGAIPATIVMKLVGDTAPFPADDPTTQLLLNAQSLSDIQAAFATATPPSASAIHFESPKLNTPMLRATAAMNIFAGIGALVMSIILVKNAWPGPGGKLPELGAAADKLTLVNSAFYFAYAAPDIFGSITATDALWETKVNTFITTLACLKAVTDAGSVKLPTSAGNPDSPFNPKDLIQNTVSPWADGILNLMWFAPPIGTLVGLIKADKLETNDIVSFVGNGAFNLSGIGSPILWFAKKMAESPAKRVAIAGCVLGIGLCNCVWGGASIMTSFDGLDAPQSDPS